MVKKNDSLIEVIQVILKWKKTIFRIVIAAIVLSAVTALLLPVYYESSTTYYVASNDLSMPEPVGNRLKEKEFYGDDDDINRSLAIANSSELINFMIDSFDLMKVYDIDPNSKKAKYAVRLNFLKHYDVKKTKLDAIQLSIESKEPEKAKNMVKAAKERIAYLTKKSVKSIQKKMLAATKISLFDKKELIDQLSSELQHLRDSYQIYNIFAQSEALSLSMASMSSQIATEKAKLNILSKSSGIRRDTLSFIKARIGGLEEGFKATQKSLNLFNSGLSKLVLLETTFKGAVKQYQLDEERYKQLDAALKNDNEVLIIIEKEDVPTIKSRPKRSLIVIGAALVALLFSVLGVLVLDFYRDVDWKKNRDE